MTTMPMSWRHSACTTVALVALAGCADAGAYAADRDRPNGPQRSVRSDVDWTIGVRIGGSPEDSVLLMPTRPTVGDAGIFLADFATKRVIHFNHQGEVVWTFGQDGAGPDEFREPRDVRLDAHGNVWVLDTGNARVTVLRPDGTVKRRIPVDIGDAPIAIIPLEDGTAILTGRRPDRTFVRIDHEGRAVDEAAFPWDGFNRMSGLSTQYRAVHDPERSVWGTTFNVGDGFFLFDQLEWTGVRGWFVEEVRFPIPEVTQSGNETITRFAQRPISSAVSATLSPQRLYVLFGGRSEDRFRIVDGYDLATGRYVHTYRLPERVIHLAWHDGGFYALFNNPYPELIYWKPADTTLP